MFFLVLAIGFFSFFVRFFRRHWGPPLCVRMNPYFVHTTVRIRPCPKNKTGQMAGRSPSTRYTRAQKQVSAARLRAGYSSDTGHTPRKLPRKPEQSPASSHNTPCFPHRRSVSIPICNHSVKRNFVIFAEIFSEILCRATNSKNNPFRLPGSTGRLSPGFFIYYNE